MLAMSSSMRSGMREAFSMGPSITAPAARHRNLASRQVPRNYFASPYVCICAVTVVMKQGEAGALGEV